MQCIYIYFTIFPVWKSYFLIVFFVVHYLHSAFHIPILIILNNYKNNKTKRSHLNYLLLFLAANVGSKFNKLVCSFIVKYLINPYFILFSYYRFCIKNVYFCICQLVLTPPQMFGFGTNLRIFFFYFIIFLLFALFTISIFSSSHWMILSLVEVSCEFCVVSLELTRHFDYSSLCNIFTAFVIF